MTGRFIKNPIVNSHFSKVIKSYFATIGLIKIRYNPYVAEFKINKEFPKGILGAFSPVFAVYKISVIAPIKPDIIPKAFIALIFSFKIIAEKIKTKIGAIVIKMELFTGVDNSNPLKKASIFITIPKKEHKTILGQSFFSIELPL